MSDKNFSSELVKLFGDNGMKALISYDKAEKFRQLWEIMCEENGKYNLTSITEPGEVMLLHYADSLTLSPYLSKKAKVIDVGTGAGFPALPLALCREDLDITAADSTEKKVNYINSTAAVLGLSNIRAVTLRAEEAAKGAEVREKFDYAVARGVSRLNILCEYLLPYVRVGGRMIAMKGPGAVHEVSEAKKAIAMLGGRLKETVPTPLIGKDGKKVEHSLVIIEKIAKTPALYPRQNNQIQKKPL